MISREFQISHLRTLAMLSASDLIHLPYAPDLTEAGIACAARSLVSAYQPSGTSPLEHLRLSVAELAVELAFRRALSAQDIPISVDQALPFTRPGWFDLFLGGHRGQLKSFFVTRRSQIARLHRDPALFLQVPTLLPLDQFAADGHKPDDLYLFAFLLGLVASSREDEEKALAAGQPVHLVHSLPARWARPASWLPLENLVLKSECAAPLRIEITGQNADREFMTASLELPPRERLPVEQGFHSLVTIHSARRPEARIGIHSPLRGKAHLIPAHSWGNIWVYGMDIVLVGWLTHQEYRRKAKVLNAGMSTFLVGRTTEKNLLVPVAALNPLAPLLARLKQWQYARLASALK
jgi:hypothetical protein